MLIVPPSHVAGFLAKHHYLGATDRGVAWWDDFGVLVLANPTSRRLPQERWLELTRWCLVRLPNAGSQQWAAVRRWLLKEWPEVTTVVSYSDPARGHTGALYRACGWLWAPTWHRLRPPPSGNGQWKIGDPQSTKDRWICPLRPDAERERLLWLNDDALVKRVPWAIYREPVFRKGRAIGGGADYQEFQRCGYCSIYSL